jgi:Protein of unknown function (DUF2934)
MKRKPDMEDKAKRIREIAHNIWEEEGRPSGREGQHWERARQIVEMEHAGRAPPAPQKSTSPAEQRADT